VLEVGLDGFVLLVEIGEVRDNVFYDIGVGEWVDFGFFLGVSGDAAQASKSIDTINVHGTASTDTLSATSSKGQGGINLILDSYQSIQHHRTRLVQIQRICLHVRLL